MRNLAFFGLGFLLVAGFVVVIDCRLIIAEINGRYPVAVLDKGTRNRKTDAARAA